MKKGFTLVELLGVIMILGILALVTTNVISNSLNESKNDLYNIQINNIIESAKVWANANVFSLPENDGEFVDITLGELKEAGFMDDDVINPITNEQFSNSMKVRITKIGNNYSYNVEEL